MGCTVVRQLSSAKRRGLAGAVLSLSLAVFPVLSHASEVKVTLPRLSVAEYHAPYVAVWLADAKQKRVKDVAVWYDVEMENGKGEKWLKDLRLWWRRSGRSADLPMDGISGATRRPGEHTIDLSGQFDDIPAGEYTLNVEAARELGGREVLSVPVTLPVSASQHQVAEGDQELSEIELTLEP